MGRTMANLHKPAYNLQVIFSGEPLSRTPCRVWSMGCSSIQKLTRLSLSLVLYANKCQLYWLGLVGFLLVRFDKGLICMFLF